MFNSFPICRTIFDHWIYIDSDYLKIWVTMLGKARYLKDAKTGLYQNIKYSLEYGQFIYGRLQWSKDLNVGEQKLRTCIKKLLNDDMIKLVEQTSKFTIYEVVNYEKFNQQDNQQEAQQNQRLQGYDNQQNNQQITTTQPSDNHQITTNKESKEGKEKKNIIYSENGELNQAILDFIQMRKSTKKPMTDRAVTLMLGKLNQLSANEKTQIEILNQSIMNSWQGIFALKENETQQKQYNNHAAYEAI